MKNWWQKSLVITVALATFGVISPNHAIWENFLDEKEPSKVASADYVSPYEAEWADPSKYWVTDEMIVESMHQSAEEQSYVKFGSRIGPVIRPDFDTVIFPKIQQAIDEYTAFLDSQHLRRLSVSENPSGNHSEKIFHIYDSESGEDLLRFHVRTEKKPLEGYSFNFHYHAAADNFESHHSVGDIFWSKNTPPKWLS
ncbi:YpjP family protein [Planococcus lenghuensis]|uniref:YpjP-like protein n=1 Tax=Planococcus lenghuensis TaxID=2213202 RepID=A0A1Q2L3U7_9BACL|nr:YpjP family protein [Planococcus lenghuensis]AQQ55093.1 hypothetical protein B0X71_10865 [Planococcus lenghuensis]